MFTNTLLPGDLFPCIQDIQPIVSTHVEVRPCIFDEKKQVAEAYYAFRI